MEFLQKLKLYLGGGRRLGVKVLEWLVGLEWVFVAAVCPIPAELDKCHAAEMRRVIRDYHLRECTLEEIMEEDFDLGLSVNYHRIIPSYILAHCKKGFYNVHHSYNLRLKGRNITTHAILNSRKEGIYYHGTTLHRMVPELDAGPIAASYACNIEKDDTAYTLFQKVDSLAFEMIKEWFPRIALQRVYLYPAPEEGIHSYRNKGYLFFLRCWGGIWIGVIWEYRQITDTRMIFFACRSPDTAHNNSTNYKSVL